MAKGALDMFSRPRAGRRSQRRTIDPTIKTLADLDRLLRLAESDDAVVAGQAETALDRALEANGFTLRMMAQAALTRPAVLDLLRDAIAARQAGEGRVSSSGDDK